MNKKPTLKDIAKICNCSITTASRALKRSHTISKSMQEKVQKTATELGYIPNDLATSMRTGSTMTIAVCLQDFRNPFFSAVAKYTEQYARTHGYFTLFVTTNEAPEQEYEACKSLLGKNVDGVLLFPIQHDTKAVELLIEQKTPFVLVGRYFDNIDSNYVISDDGYGAYLVTRHLISRNAKNILFLNAPEFISSSRERKHGYLRALEESGAKPHIIESSMEYGKTRELLISMGSKLKKFDAILLFCDMMGFEAYNTLNSLGYAVPKDILLAGFDGLQQDIILPIELTSAAIDRKLMVENAVDLLLQIINERNFADTEHIVIDQYLLEGHTT
jgi:LacI family transcriptional regulator